MPSVAYTSASQNGVGLDPMVVLSKGLVTSGECWYEVPAVCPGVDVLRCLQIETPLPGSQTTNFRTIWIDLTKSEDQLFREMNKTTRNEIRRASEEGLQYEFWHRDASPMVDSFCDFVERHGTNERTGRRDANRWSGVHAGYGTLDLSRVSHADGRVLVWHAYYRDRCHARLKYSVSLRRETAPLLGAAIGRANRFLHWEDMKRFKAAGMQKYDLGGWYFGEDDQKLLRINKFKEGFGGEIRASYHCTRALTAKGRIFLWAAGLRSRLLQRS